MQKIQMLIIGVLKCNGYSSYKNTFWFFLQIVTLEALNRVSQLTSDSLYTEHLLICLF